MRLPNTLVALTLVGLLASALRAAEPLTIVCEPYPPFEYEDDDGRPAGFDVEIVGRIMRTLDIPYQIKFYPFARAWMMVTKGAADAVLSVSYQPEREAALHFTPGQREFLSAGTIAPDYLWITHYVFFINRRFDASLRFASLEQVKDDGYRVGLIREYSYTADFRAWADTVKTAVYTTPADGLRALAAGEIDVLPIDRCVGLALLDKLDLRATLTYLPREIFAKPYLCAFAKASSYPDLTGIAARFHAELSRLHESGEYASLWAATMPPLVRNPPRPLIFVCEEWHPFEYLDDGKPSGIDVEVTDLIMRKLGLPYEFRFYPWSRAWMMVTKGAADAVLSVSYKESREGDLFFTTEQREFAASGALPPDYLWMSKYVFFVKTRDATKLRFESLAQLKTDGFRIGTNRDYSYCPEFLEAGLPGATYNNIDDAIRGLVNDEIDLYPMDLTAGQATLKRLGLADSVAWLPKPLLRKPYLAPFVRLSNYPDLERLMHAYYAELRTLKQTGAYDRIRARYTDAERLEEPVKGEDHGATP